MSNTKKTDDRKHNLVDIIDKGTKSDIHPKRKFLYIPLTQKGKRKKPRAKPEGLKVYEDYILVKKVKKKKGSGFLKKTSDKYSIFLTRLVIEKIRQEVNKK